LGIKHKIKALSSIFGNFSKIKDGTIQIKYQNYDEYKKIQVQGNKEKLNNQFEYEENIQMLSNYLKENLDEIKFGLCHGTRQGKEQEWFTKYLANNTKVLGTEISDTATQFPNTIKWDFHEVKDEWINNVDFIYSNSLDHSYDATHCLKQWFRCLRKGGICIINGSSANRPYFSYKLDPFGFTKDGLGKMIGKLSKECSVKIETFLDGVLVKKKKYNVWYYCIIRKV